MEDEPKSDGQKPASKTKPRKRVEPTQVPPKKRKRADGPEKKRDNKRKRQSISESLEPFSFLIYLPPISCMKGYPQMVEWLEGAINQEFEVHDNPFHLKVDVQDREGLSEDWIKLTTELNDPTKLQQNWVKSTIVNKILCLYAEEQWRENNLIYTKLQRDIWWVNTAQSWFDLSHIDSTQQYIKTGLSALTLELFYRFVWARHTSNVHASVMGYDNETPLHENQSCTTPKQNSPQNSQKSIKETQQPTDVPTETQIDAEMQMESDSETEEDEKDSSSTQSSSQERPESRDTSPIKQEKKKKTLKKNVSDLDNEEVLLAEELGQSDSEEDGFSSDGEGDSNEIIEDDLPKKSSDQGEVVPHLSVDQMEEEGSFEMETEEESEFELPKATSLFFSQADIVNMIDEIEALVLVREAEWDITKAIHLFSQLVVARNNALSVAKKSQTKSEVLAEIWDIYSTKMKPFLKNLGIKLSGSHDSVWNWETHARDYVDLIYINCFRNMTENGAVSHSRTFIQLFPKLFLLADSGAASSVSRVTNHISNVLASKGKLNPEIDSIVNMLDALVDEKSTLLKLENQKTTEDAPMNSVLLLLQQQQDQSRKNRLAEIDKTINSLQDMFNQLTGSVDQLLQGKKKEKIQKREQEKRDMEIEESRTLNEITSKLQHLVKEPQTPSTGTPLAVLLPPMEST